MKIPMVSLACRVVLTSMKNEPDEWVTKDYSRDWCHKRTGIHPFSVQFKWNRLELFFIRSALRKLDKRREYKAKMDYASRLTGM